MMGSINGSIHEGLLMSASQIFTFHLQQTTERTSADGSAEGPYIPPFGKLKTDGMTALFAGANPLAG